MIHPLTYRCRTHQGELMDALPDVYKHHRTQRQIESYLTRLGLTDVVVSWSGNGSEARGRRPRREG